VTSPENLHAELSAALASAKTEIERHVLGQSVIIEQALVTLLSGGHGLLIGVPGLAKTKLVETLGVVLGLSSRRIQFTPDLMPSDILGSEILESMDASDSRKHFRFIHGPIFAELVMADEINRASPRTQSALLQGMQEHEVSINGVRHPLPSPFHVLATQNPLDNEGTYPLPEAQLDRFLLSLAIDYPERADERAILLSTTQAPPPPPQPMLTPALLLQAQKLVRRLPISDRIVDKILDLVRSLRPDTCSDLSFGAGTRAGQALMLATRARALLQGRLSPSSEDVEALALPVLRHRLGLSFSARANGQTVETLIAARI
jgi:MoxR-like ATPase